MDLSILQRSLNKENLDSDTPSLVRPKLSFSVASLLASAVRSASPRVSQGAEADSEEPLESHEAEAEEEDEEINPEDSDAESEVSVDSHGDNDDTNHGYSSLSRLNDSSDIDQDLSASSPTRYAPSQTKTLVKTKTMVNLLDFKLSLPFQPRVRRSVPAPVWWGAAPRVWATPPPRDASSPGGGRAPHSAWPPGSAPAPRLASPAPSPRRPQSCSVQVRYEIIIMIWELHLKRVDYKFLDYVI